VIKTKSVIAEVLTEDVIEQMRSFMWAGLFSSYRFVFLVTFFVLLILGCFDIPVVRKVAPIISFLSGIASLYGFAVQ